MKAILQNKTAKKMFGSDFSYHPKSSPREENALESMPRIFSLETHQDDPKKCTAAKMRRMGLARGISKRGIPSAALVLNPSSDLSVLKNDRDIVVNHGIVVIDCSWVKLERVFKVRFNGIMRKLPALLAGNPTNYSKMGMLSSLEAVAACLYITGFTSPSMKLLSLYKWGETFFTLNQALLEDYSKATSHKEVEEVERSYFPRLIF